MHRAFRILAACLATAIALPAFASPESDAASNCLVDHTNGRDRKDLVRWFVISIAAHPEISAMLTVTPTTRDDASRKTGELFTRLIAVDCTAEMKAAIKVDGQMAFKTAFGKLGQVAVQELMSDQNVMATMGGVDKYIDAAALRDALAR